VLGVPGRVVDAATLELALLEAAANGLAPAAANSSSTRPPDSARPRPATMPMTRYNRARKMRRSA
jgi:hypothetical protein